MLNQSGKYQIVAILAILALASLFPFHTRATEICENSAGKIQMQISGQFFHAKAVFATPILNINKNNEEAFREEVAGSDFVVTVSPLAAGKYTIIIGEAETYVKAPGQRVFDISCGDTLLATDLDIFKTSGGFGKAYYISANVHHADDAVGGPLAITFLGHQEKAKFNTIEIRNASGETVVDVKASEFANVFDSATRHLPQVRGPEMWKDPKQSVDARVEDLIRRMSLAEKACQLDMYAGSDSLLAENQKIDGAHAKSSAVFTSQLAAKNFGSSGVGSIHDLYPNPKLYNAIQAWVIKSNRLGIPALFIEEGLHGYMGYGETVFPHSVNLAATWNPELAKATGAAIAAEARANGVDMILGPVLDIARDPRWGRVEEDFGEDPFLSGQLGLNYVEGMQGDSLATDHTVIAEPKHFAAHGSPESGLNTSPVHAGEREVRTVMLKAFEPAIREAHAMGIMAAYHDIDGVPCTGNTWLLNTVLRDEWGFKGFVLADLGAIRRLYDTHHVASSALDAVCLAINSGVDMQFYDFDHQTFQDAIIVGVEAGKIPTNTLDQAVCRVLRVKFLLGLFDHPFVDENLDANVRRSKAHLDLSLEVARQSMCLVKNQSNLLPLDKNVASIAVIGPNANVARFGDYASAAAENFREGMVEQIKKLVSPTTRVIYSSGQDVNEAIELAKQAKVVILGLGEWNGISGEWHDRSELGLPGHQQALLEAVMKTGVPVVLVLQNGRALTIPWAAEHVPAILEAWYPGEFGGQAIAETLFGDNNPAGRLPVSFPKSVGQLPVFYDHFPSKNDNYIDGNDEPQFPFGYGLSYTTFKYGHLDVVAPESSSEDVVVSFDLTNAGSRSGDEVAQVYVHETTASVATPIKALKAFSRIHLEAGETKTVTLHIKQNELAIWGAGRTWNVEPGEFTVIVGGDSSAGLSVKFVVKQHLNGLTKKAPDQKTLEE
jgi:beta-glucosidase